MELRYASIDQVRKGKGGREVHIDAGSDVFDMVRQIKEIDPKLSVHWNDDGEYFEIRELCADLKERLVLTSLELDQRLLEHLRKIGSPDWNVADEIDRHEAQREAKIDHATHERVGEIGEQMAHALRKDLQHKGRIFLPRGVNLAD